MASERVIPGYGGGMSSAKAALESDTRFLAFEAGRASALRVNAISAGPFASRAASAIGIIDAMVEYCAAELAAARALRRTKSATTAAFLSSPLAQRHHRDDGVRRQGLPRDGQGARARRSRLGAQGRRRSARPVKRRVSLKNTWPQCGPTLNSRRPALTSGRQLPA